MSIQQCGDNKLHNSSFTWFTLQGWQTWSISNELHIKIWPPLSKWITLLLTFSPRLPLYLYFCISSSVHNTYMYARAHKQEQAHTRFYLLVTRCQREQVEGTTPHAEPSVCRCLSLSGTQHTNTARLKEASALQQCWDCKHNSCGERDYSQDIRQRRTVKQQNNWQLCWLQLFFFSGKCERTNVHFKPLLLLPFYKKKGKLKQKYGHNCRICRLEYIVLVWCQQTAHTPIDQSSKQLYF